MKKSVSLLFFLLIARCILAQETVISGSILNQEGEPVPGASITVSGNTGLIIAFAQADKHGAFKLTINYRQDSLRVKVSMLGYYTQDTQLLNKSVTLRFNLKRNIVELKPVELKTTPIWQRKDTLNYSVSAFRQQQDKVIGDIMARIPGVEVRPGGQIFYNGRPINRYYIEGLDLLEGRYGLANNNLPADAVEKIQILENHQPVQVLDSLVYTQRAAINLKLKKDYTGKLITTVKAGAGAGAARLLSEDELLNMAFKRKWQVLNTCKFNNTGTDNLRDITTYNLTDIQSAIRIGVPDFDFLSVNEPPRPAINQSRFLFNNAHVLSVNQLFPLTSTSGIRININYVQDKQDYDAVQETEIQTPGSLVKYVEESKTRKHTGQLQAAITYTINRKNYYLNNVTRFNGQQNSRNGSLTGTFFNLNQGLETKASRISNEFSLITSKRKSVRQLHLNLLYSRNPQELLLRPGTFAAYFANGNPYEQLTQLYTPVVNAAEFKYSRTKRHRNLIHSALYGMAVQQKDIRSGIGITRNNLYSQPDSLTNKFKWIQKSAFVENSLVLEHKKMRYTLQFPVSVTQAGNTAPAQSVKIRTLLLLSPSVNLLWQFSKHVAATTALSFSQYMNQPEDLLRSPVLNHYRRLFRSEVEVQKNRTVSGQANITFKNPLKAMFANMGFRLSVSRLGTINDHFYTDQIDLLRMRNYVNPGSNYECSGTISKYMIALKTTVTANLRVSGGRTVEMVNAQLLHFRQNALFSNVTVNAKISDKFTVDIKELIIINSTRVREMPGQFKNQLFNLIGRINYFPAKWISTYLALDHNRLRSDLDPLNRAVFSDAGISISPSKKRIVLELLLQNLANTRVFTTASIDNNISSLMRVELRPRQFLIKAGFSF